MGSPTNCLIRCSKKISDGISIAVELCSMATDQEGARGKGIVGYLARGISGYGVKER